MRGIVQSFSNKNGYGFIKGEDGLYFVHYTGIIADGYKYLNKNQEVEFVPGENDKGKIAINVRVVQ